MTAHAQRRSTSKRGGACHKAYLRYTQPVAQIMNLYNILYHFFAVDSQICKSFQTTSPVDKQNAKTTLERCIASISDIDVFKLTQTEHVYIRVHHLRNTPTTEQTYTSTR